jgi:hypothetical protein
MDDDKDDKSILEKFTDTVKDMATSVTDAAKSAMEPETGKTEDTPRMTADEIAKEAAEDPETVAEKTNEQMYISDAAAMPMPLVAPKKRKAPVRLTPAKIPPKKAAAKKSSKKAAKKKAAKKTAKKAFKKAPAKKTKSSAGRKAVGKNKTAKKVAKKKKAKR